MAKIAVDDGENAAVSLVSSHSPPRSQPHTARRQPKGPAQARHEPVAGRVCVLYS